MIKSLAERKERVKKKDKDLLLCEERVRPPLVWSPIPTYVCVFLFTYIIYCFGTHKIIEKYFKNEFNVHFIQRLWAYSNINPEELKHEYDCSDAAVSGCYITHLGGGGVGSGGSQCRPPESFSSVSTPTSTEDERDNKSTTLWRGGKPARSQVSSCLFRTFPFIYFIAKLSSFPGWSPLFL